MYRLEIQKSKSVNFPKVLAYILSIGGSFNNNKLTVSIKDELLAYDQLLPIFRLNVCKWKGTKAYFNNSEVNPYRFVFLAKKRLQNNTRELLENIENSLVEFLYYKRIDNTFYFKNNTDKFELQISGKELFDFVDKYSVGDIVIF